MNYVRGQFRNWLAKPHADMYRNINSGPGVDAATPTVDHYHKAGAILSEVQKQIERRLRSLSEGWTGQAADGAAATMKAAKEWATTAQTAIVDARTYSDRQRDIYTDTKNHMPAPVEVPNLSTGVFGIPLGGQFGLPAMVLSQDVKAAQQRADDAHAEAARRMSLYEDITYNHIGSMPEYTPPPVELVSTLIVSREQPTVAPVPGAGDFQPSGRGASSVGGDAVGSGSGTGQPAITGGQPSPIDGSHDASRGHAATTKSAATPLPSPAPTVPPAPVPVGGMDTVRPTTPFPGVPFGLSPDGGRSGDAVSNRGGRADGPAGRGTGGVRGVVEPAPVNTRGTGLGAANSARSSGSPAHGMFPGAGARREDDEERKRKYVVLDDKHLEDDSPPVAPPVIGEDDYRP